MAFKEVQSLDAEITIALGGVDKKTKKANPKQIEGYYLGFRQVDGGKYSKLANIYFFQTPKGNVGVWGKTDLNRKMTTATPGCMLRVTHAGMKATPNGDMHTYKVEIDEENTIDVSALQNQTASEYTQADDNSADVEDTVGETAEDDEFTDEYEQPEIPVTLPKGNSADRAAKVAALLGKGKK